VIGIFTEPVPHSIASALEGDDLSVVEEAVEDSCGARDIAEELAPIFEWSVACHDGASGLMPPHDDFEEIFAAVLGELLHAHIVDDQEVGSQVAGQGGVIVTESFLVEKVTDDVEDGAVERGVALLDGGVADGLGEVGLAGTWWSDEEDVTGLAEELAGGQFEELPAGQCGVELPVELIDGLEVTEAGELGAAIELAVVADGDFVLEDEFEELQMAEAAGLCFLQPNVEGACKPGEPEAAEGGAEVIVHERSLLGEGRNIPDPSR
jgi:hypothetical protein